MSAQVAFLFALTWSSLVLALGAGLLIRWHVRMFPSVWILWNQVGIVAMAAAAIKAIDTTMFGGVPRPDAATAGTLWLLTLGLVSYFVSRSAVRHLIMRHDESSK